MKNKRKDGTWELDDRQVEKNIIEFYNGGSSFSPSINAPGTFQLVPRFAFDDDKKGTGTALYNYHNFSTSMEE